jgi:hypothetical protein
VTPLLCFSRESRAPSADAERCRSPGIESIILQDTAIASAVTDVASPENIDAGLVHAGSVDAVATEARGRAYQDGVASRSHGDDIELGAATSHGAVDDDVMSSSSFSDESSSVLSSAPSSPMSACPSGMKSWRSSSQRPAASSPAQALAEVQRAAMRPKNKTEMRKTATAHVFAVTSASQTALKSLPLPAEDIDACTSGAMQDSSNVIFPRRKQGQHKKHGRKEGVVVTMEILETVFHMPLHKACNELGVCATALKRACRKLGVQKWPYRDQQCQSQRSMGASQEENREEAPTRTRPATTNSQQLQRSKAAGGMREGTRGASLRIGARAAVQRGGEQADQIRGGYIKKEPSSPQAGPVSNVRESSSDFESSVDTRIASLHDDVAQENDVPVAQQCTGSPAAFSNLILPGEDSLLLSASRSADDFRVCGEYVNQEDEFDSFDSEEDGLVSDELESWGLTEARLERFASETLSLEDCLKV